ncbi:hypothetical protein ACNQFZ_20160 [Schinkia sp. CFF1]
MKGQKCSNCGYYMSFGEAALYNIGAIFGNKKKGGATAAIGINTASNITKVQCPKCGAVGRWIREDE